MTKDEAIETLSDIRSEYNCFEPTERPRYRALSMAIKALKTELIHCKDCEYYSDESCTITFDIYGFWQEMKPNDYCSRAERKEE